MRNLKPPRVNTGKSPQTPQCPSGAMRTNHKRVPLPTLHATVCDEPFASMSNPPKDYRPLWCPLVPDGSHYVCVRLKCGSVAVMDAADWERITEKYGASPLMWLQTQQKGTKYEAHHVVTTVPDVGIFRRVVRVAALVARLSYGDTLSYRDHDPRNLTRANLRRERRNLAAYRRRHRNHQP